MRTLHFTDTYLPRRDGVVTSIRTLAAALSAQGHEARIVVPRHPEQGESPELIQLSALPCGIADLRMSRWPLRRAWAEGALAEITAAGPEVVHVHTPGPVGLLGVLAARHLGIPLVQTYHTDLHAYVDAYRVPPVALKASLHLYARRLGTPRPETPRHSTRPGLFSYRQATGTRRRAVIDATNSLLLGGAGALVVPTRAVLDRLELPVPADRVHIIPTGVAAKPTTPAAVREFRRTHGIAEGDRVVLFVGRVNREKGLDLLAAAFGRLSDPRAKLVLVGAVYDRKWLTALLQKHGITDRVVVAGQQGSDVVAAAYGSADLFVFPSTSDTQALVLQEAAHAKLPVVMVDAGLHAHGPLAGAALLTEPEAGDLAAGIGALLANPAAAAELGARGAVNAAGHTPEAYAHAVLSVYQSGVKRDAVLISTP